MKYLLTVLAVFTFIAAPEPAQAATFAARDTYTTGPATRIDDDLYVAAGTASVVAGVPGDLIVAGGTVSVTGDVGDDVLAAGGTLNLLGSVGGDIRAVGGTITINGHVGGDVVVAGGSVTLLADAVVEGDVHVTGGSLTLEGAVRGDAGLAGGTVTLNGPVGGSVRSRTDQQLRLGPGALIAGDLAYRAPGEAVIEPGASVAGRTDYTELSRSSGNRSGSSMDFRGVVTGGLAAALAGLATGFALFRLLVLLGAAAVVVWLVRRPATDAVQDASANFGRSLWHGVVYALLVPVGALLLVMSFVGAIPGAMLILGYFNLCLAASVLAGVFLGSWVVKLAKKRSAMHITWLSALGGVLLFELIAMIPFVGWLARAAIWLAVLGVLGDRVRDHLERTLGR